MSSASYFFLALAVCLSVVSSAHVSMQTEVSEPLLTKVVDMHAGVAPDFSNSSWTGANATEHQALRANALRGNLKGCSCVNGLYLYGYENFVPSSTGGAGCIGGCGGGDFVYHKEGVLVKSLTFWSGCGTPNNGFRALQVYLFDGSSAIFGNPLGCNNPASYTFSPGETLQGNLILSGNGIGSRSGYISFTTSKGSFSAGDNSRDKYLFNADGLMIAGVFGGAGDDLDRLGIIFTKRIASSQLMNMRYPTLDMITTGLAPVLLVKKTFCNDAKLDQSSSVAYTQTEGEDKCWKVEASMSFGYEFKVSGGIPEVAKTETTYKWGLTVSGGYNACTKTSNTKTYTYPWLIPARHRCQLQITQWDSVLTNLPFNAEFKLFFTDGSSTSISTSGSYSGAFVTSADEAVHCEALADGQSCMLNHHEMTSLQFEK